MANGNENGTFKVKMRQTRVTKNTIRYDAEDDDARVANVYVRKDSTWNPPPDGIEIEVRRA